MSKKSLKIFEAIGEVDDDLLIETEEAASLKVLHDKKRSFRFKAIGAVAACIAVVVGASAVLRGFGNTPAPDSKNSFFLTAYAAEATEDEAVLKNDSYVHIGGCRLDKESISANERLQTFVVSCSWTFPIRCHGDNIKSIRYRIQNGVFRFDKSNDKNLYYDIYTFQDKITDDFKDSGNSGSAVFPDDSENDILAYSVDYDKQSECKRDDVYLRSELSTKDEELPEGLKKLLERFYKHSSDKRKISAEKYEEELNEVCLALVSEIEIGVEVSYKDGSKDDQSLKLVLEGVDNNTIYVGVRLA